MLGYSWEYMGLRLRLSFTTEKRKKRDWEGGFGKEKKEINF